MQFCAFSSFLSFFLPSFCHFMYFRFFGLEFFYSVIIILWTDFSEMLSRCTHSILMKLNSIQYFIFHSDDCFHSFKWFIWNCHPLTPYLFLFLCFFYESICNLCDGIQLPWEESFVSFRFITFTWSCFAFQKSVLFMHSTIILLFFFRLLLHVTWVPRWMCYSFHILGSLYIIIHLFIVKCVL